MIWRQEYADPPSRALVNGARILTPGRHAAPGSVLTCRRQPSPATRTSRGRAAAPSHTGTAEHQPTAPASPRRATAAATQPTTGRVCRSPRSGLELCPQLLACHRRDCRGMTTQTRPFPLPAASARPREAPSPAGTRHRRCLSPAARPAACAAGSVFRGLVAAGSGGWGPSCGCPVSVLQAAPCGEPSRRS